MEEGDYGDSKEPEPKNEVELLVHNIVWQHTQHICLGITSRSAKLEDRQNENREQLPQPHLLNRARGDYGKDSPHWIGPVKGVFRKAIVVYHLGWE